MGTYLSLELKNKSNGSISLANQLWNLSNPGFEDTLHFNTQADIQADVDAIWTDPRQEHLRYIKSVKDFNKHFPIWGTGRFQVKITMGDYLCSEMARRYVDFIEDNPSLFVELPSEYEMSILKETAAEERRATSCLVECPYCKPVAEDEGG